MHISTTNLQNAFGKYLILALEGTEIIITKNGHSIAKLEKLSDEMIQEELTTYYAEKKMSYIQFLAMTEESDYRYEYIDGEIYLLASPRFDHQGTSMKLTLLLSDFLKENPCEVFAAPLDITLSRDITPDKKNVVQPDLMIICDTDNVENSKYLGIPELLVEILSPSTRSKDMIKKLDLYMSSGIKEYWLVDIENQQILLYHFEDFLLKTMMSYHINQTFQSVLYEDLSFDVSTIFS